jgi:CBS domain containing-hemolysin-like protein
MYPLHDLRDRLDLPDLATDTVDTIGGYIIEHLGRWPRAGDTLPLADRYNARVLSVVQRRVGQVLITPAPPKQNGNGKPEQ